MSKTINHLLIITFSVIFLTFLVWLPHILSLSNFWGLNFKEGFNTILRNFDGLEYVIISKTFYDPALIASIPQSQSANYFASHFPGYSILIAIFTPVLGALKSMLFVSVVSTILAAWAFYFLIRDFKLTNHPLFLTLVFLILPARWVIVHSVGSSEPLFMFLVITTAYFFMKYELHKNFLSLFLAGIFGLAAQITRPPGILIFLGLVFYILWKAYKERSWVSYFKYFPLILIPAGLLIVFFVFGQQYNDFWAYFHSGDNIHLTFPPFQVFNNNQYWVGDIWLEDIVYLFLLGFLGVVTLWKKNLFPLAFIAGTYLIASTLVAHRDISRYILPITPFVLIAFEKVLTSKEFKIILPLIALATYLYSQNYIINNVAPIPNIGVYN